MPPQLNRPLVQIVVAPGEIFNRKGQCVPPKADLKVGLYVRNLYVGSGGPSRPPKTEESNRNDGDGDIRDEVANP